MPVSVVVGGQFGSEGKGKVAHWICKNEGAKAAVRVGGPNSGHTVITDSGNKIVLRQLPTASILSNVLCVIPTGGYIIPEVLLHEIRTTRLAPEQLVIDPFAVIVQTEDANLEAAMQLGSRIGSTQSGMGAAVLRRIHRDGTVLFAKDCPALSSYIGSANQCLRLLIDKGHRVVIEGTQGFGLSLLHGTDYPNVTSRDTIASSFVAEAGLSPIDVDDIVLVIRSFPIRVAGNSGELPSETSWEYISDLSGRKLCEYTSVTQKVRRVALFDGEVVRRAISVNNPSRIVINHVDYVCRDCNPHDIGCFLNRVETTIQRTIDLVGTTPRSILLNREEAKMLQEAHG